MARYSHKLDCPHHQQTSRSYNLTPEASTAHRRTPHRGFLSVVQLIRDVMTKGKEAGLNVVRAWATSASSNYALQTSPGNFSEVMFRGLDYALDQARQLDLKVGWLVGQERQSPGLPGRLFVLVTACFYIAKARSFLFSFVLFSLS